MNESRILALKEIQADIQKQIIAKCTHTTNKGDLRVESLDDDKVKCKLCDAEFSLLCYTEVTDENLQDVVHQLKCFLGMDSNELPSYIHDLSTITNREAVANLYIKTMNSITDKKKKKRHRNI